MDIVNYTINSNQGTAITDTCKMFFKKIKGRRVFGIYSTDDATLLYAARNETAERENLFVEKVLEEINNGNDIDTSAEGFDIWTKAVWMQRNANSNYDGESGTAGRSAGNAKLHGGSFRLYANPALQNVLENIFEKQYASRAIVGRASNTDIEFALGSEPVDTDLDFEERMRHYANVPEYTPGMERNSTVAEGPDVDEMLHFIFQIPLT